MRAYLITPATQRVRLVSFTADQAFGHIQRLTGCESVTVAITLLNSDVLFVDDAGLTRNAQHFFRFANHPVPLAGNGVLVGIDNDTSERFIGRADPRTTPDQLAELIDWRNRYQIEAWARANASEPAGTVSMARRGGTRVVQTIGELFGVGPPRRRP